VAKAFLLKHNTDAVQLAAAMCSLVSAFLSPNISIDTDGPELAPWT